MSDNYDKEAVHSNWIMQKFGIHLDAIRDIGAKHAIAALCHHVRDLETRLDRREDYEAEQRELAE